MIQRIHTRLRTRICPSENARIVFLVNPPCPTIHITHIQMNARCASGTGTGTKVPRSLGTISRSCSTLSVTLHFHCLPFLKLNGVSSTRSSAEITLMATYHSGWVKMMVGSVHRSQYRCHFIVAQRIKDVKTTLFKGSTTVPSFLLCERKSLIPHMQHSFTTHRINCGGTRHIGMTT